MRNSFNCIDTADFLIGFPKDIIEYCNYYMEDAKRNNYDEIYDDLKFVKDFILYLKYNDNDLIRISKTPMGDFDFKIIDYLDVDEELEGDGEDES